MLVETTHLTQVEYNISLADMDRAAAFYFLRSIATKGLSTTVCEIVQEVHSSRVMGWWLVLLVNYAVIGNGSNMIWS